ncbi:Retrovirus-related Pol polyprotein from transposon [Dictyocoela muelleri]|nr:Retrovirus-related Pol polyprotein from transposon [Dictyocoela muelleri]
MKKNENSLMCEKKNKNNVIVIPMSINGLNTMCLIDTGATDNFISEKLCKRLNIEISTLNEKKIIETANGENVEIKKNALLNFQLLGDKDKIYKAVFFVLQNSSSDVILCSDFLIRNKAVIDFNQGSIRVDNSEYELEGFDKNDNQFDEKLIEKTKICEVKRKKEQFNKFIEPYIFKNPKLGHITTLKRSINLNSNKILNHKQYTVPISIQKEAIEHLKNLEHKNIIRRQQSRFSSPAFFIKKKNGDLRLVVDYRGLNKITEPMNFSIPSFIHILVILRIQ